MSLAKRAQYYRRIFRAYLLPGKSQLTFWHETPEANPNLRTGELGEYYMLFSAKADYAGHHDEQGIPMLNYHGEISLQYNPIAIAQWGLGNYNLLRQSGEALRRERFLAAADWLTANLTENPHGVWVWNHHFDWEYREALLAPWYSGLAQGQGISLLLRAYKETGAFSYLDAARRAFHAFEVAVDAGGVTFTDDHGNLWFEEYLVTPPTHILNGFIWATWGVYDYFLATREESARRLFDAAIHTLQKHLADYDLGFWSLYEISGTRLPMVASAFYHRLHIVQLRILHQLTGVDVFSRSATRWERYAQSRIGRIRALGYKSAFKLCYY